MTPDMFAAIVRKYGTLLPCGEYEISVSSAEVADLRARMPRSVVREYRSLVRNATFFRLFQQPLIIDCAAVPAEAEPPAAPVPPTEALPDPTVP